MLILSMARRHKLHPSAESQPEPKRLFPLTPMQEYSLMQPRRGYTVMDYFRDMVGALVMNHPDIPILLQNDVMEDIVSNFHIKLEGKPLVEIVADAAASLRLKSGSSNPLHLVKIVDDTSRD